VSEVLGRSLPKSTSTEPNPNQNEKENKTKKKGRFENFLTTNVNFLQQYGPHDLVSNLLKR
jgi:hypothetical protein